MNKEGSRGTANLLVMNQRVLTKLSRDEVVFSIPQGDEIIDFHTNQSGLSKLRLCLSCDAESAKLQLRVGPESELLLKFSDSKLANQCLNDLHHVRRLLKQSRWPRTAARAFALGATVGVLALLGVLLSLTLLVGDYEPVSASSLSTSPAQMSAKEAEKAEQWQP